MSQTVSAQEPLISTFTAPASKPESQRALLSASLADGRSTINGFLQSRETGAMINACRAIGAKIEQQGPRLIAARLKSRDGRTRDTAYIWAGGSALISLVFAALGAILPERLVIDGDNVLRKRPLAPLLRALEEKGCAFDYFDKRHAWPFAAVATQLPGGNFRLATSISSQFSTALLVSTPFANEDTSLELTGTNFSLSYIFRTIEMMRRFGIDISVSEDQQTIRAQRIPSRPSLSFWDWTKKRPKPEQSPDWSVQLTRE